MNLAKLYACALTCCISLSLTTRALAETLRVCSGCPSTTPGNYTSTSEALRASSAGDRILVAKGNYDESLGVRHRITIEGGYNNDFSTRDSAANPVRIRYIQTSAYAEGGNMAVYRGLEITGSTSQGIYHAAPTLGIRIEDCHIHNNQGGVYIRPAVERIEIINNEIHDNAGYGGIYVFSPEETLPIRITDNHIYNTTSSTGTVGCVSLAGRWVTCFCSHSMQTQAL